MPRVQLYGGQSVASPQVSEARFRAANAGDGGMAESVAQFGRQLGAYADDEAKTRAEDLMLQADQRMKAAAVAFKGQAGKNALDARGDVMASIDAAREEVIGAAKDPLVRRYLQPLMAKYHGLYTDGISTHAAEQERAYAKEVGTARAANFADSAILARDNPALLGQFMESYRGQIETNLRNQGFGSDDIIKAETRKGISGLHASIVDAYIADDDIDMASAYFAAHQDAMLAGDETAVSGRLRGPLQKREAYADASLVLGVASPVSGAPTNYADPLRGLASHVSSAYGAQRGSKTHNGVDFAAPAGTPIHSIGAGTVKKVGSDPKSGNFIVVDHGDGTTSSYAHMDGASPLKPGDMVTPDTMIGAVGSTGRSTGPHLHFVVRKNGATVDPQSVIGEAQQAPKRHNLDTALARADMVADQQGWPFERRERAKAEIKNRVSLDETLQARVEDEADRAADAILVHRRDGFTDTNQIPREVWDKLSSTAKIKYQNIAEANSKPKSVAGNGETVTGLQLMRIEQPEVFAQVPLGQYAHAMTPAEFAGLLKDQATLKTRSPQPNDIRAKVSATISTYDTPDLGFGDKDEGAKRRVMVQRIMEADIEAVTGGKRQPTEGELYQAFTSATGVALRFDKTIFGMKTGGQREVRRFEVKASDIPDDVANRIRASLQERLGIRAPTDEQIAEEYARGKGRFW